MKAVINNGGPAFPHFKFAENGKVEICPQGGMTLRDYFAGQVLAGYATAKFGLSEKTIATYSYMMADAMLAAREASK